MINRSPNYFLAKQMSISRFPKVHYFRFRFIFFHPTWSRAKVAEGQGRAPAVGRGIIVSDWNTIEASDRDDSLVETNWFGSCLRGGFPSACQPLTCPLEIGACKKH